MATGADARAVSEGQSEGLWAAASGYALFDAFQGGEDCDCSELSERY